MIEIDWFYKNDGSNFSQTYFSSPFSFTIFYHVFIEGLKRKVVYQISKISTIIKFYWKKLHIIQLYSEKNIIFYILFLLNNELILFQTLRAFVIDLDMNYLFK
jgi:hypothetical protein